MKKTSVFVTLVTMVITVILLLVLTTVPLPPVSRDLRVLMRMLDLSGLSTFGKTEMHILVLHIRFKGGGVHVKKVKV